MTHTPSGWWDFGYYGIFGCVFLEQIGVPIPAFPALLAAGALVTSGELSLPVCLAVAVAASLMADLIWYSVGRSQGGSVLNLMCKLSWRPDTCVAKTKSSFSVHGAKTLLIAKFIPGLSTLAPPLAGIAQVPVGRFLFYDTAGTILWAIVPLLAGAYLQKSFAAIQQQVYASVSYLPWVCAVLILVVLVWRYRNRHRYLAQLWQTLRGGIGVDDLKQRLDLGEDLVVLDVRDELSARAKPQILPKARWIPYSRLSERLSELPLEKQIVVYCDCPHDQSAASMSDWLKQHGAKKAQPLLGGLDAWIAKGYETAVWA